MSKTMKQRAYIYNRERAAEQEKAQELMTLLDHLPPGQVKLLLKDETCGPILEKYGITEV